MSSTRTPCIVISTIDATHKRQLLAQNTRSLIKYILVFPHMANICIHAVKQLSRLVEAGRQKEKPKAGNGCRAVPRDREEVEGIYVEQRRIFDKLTEVQRKWIGICRG